MYIRSLIFTTLMMVTVPIYVIPTVLIIWVFPFSVRYRIYRSWARMTIWMLKKLCNLSYEVEGKENIPQGSAIIFSKHQSTWETLGLQLIFPPIVWVLKKSLLWTPFFGWAMALLEPIPIDRGSGHKAVEQITAIGKRRLDAGRWVVIFPEGTRVPPGTHKRYGVGGGVLAEKSGYPVVPVAHNAGEYWRRRDLIKHPGVIRVAIGPAIDSKGKTAEEIVKEAERWIETKMQEITTLDTYPSREKFASTK